MLDTEAYIHNHVEIIFDMIAIPISAVHGVCEKPTEVIKWDEGTHSYGLVMRYLCAYLIAPYVNLLFLLSLGFLQLFKSQSYQNIGSWKKGSNATSHRVHRRLKW